MKSTMSLSNAASESMFSTLLDIMSDHKTKMLSSTLAKRMRLCRTGPPLSDRLRCNELVDKVVTIMNQTSVPARQAGGIASGITRQKKAAARHADQAAETRKLLEGDENKTVAESSAAVPLSTFPKDKYRIIQPMPDYSDPKNWKKLIMFWGDHSSGTGSWKMMTIKKASRQQRRSETGEVINTTYVFDVVEVGKKKVYAGLRLDKTAYGDKDRPGAWAMVENGDYN